MKNKIFVPIVIATITFGNFQIAYGETTQVIENVEASDEEVNKSIGENTEEKMTSISIDNEIINFDLVGGFLPGTILTAGGYSSSLNENELKEKYEFVAPVNLMLNKQPESPSMVLTIGLGNKRVGQEYKLIMVNSAINIGNDVINQGTVDENGNITVSVNSVTPLVLAIEKKAELITPKVEANEGITEAVTTEPTVNIPKEEKEQVVETVINKDEIKTVKKNKEKTPTVENSKKAVAKKEVKNANTKDKAPLIFYGSLIIASLLGISTIALKKIRLK